MANILTVILILAIVLKVVDFSAITWLDYAILALLFANAALSFAKWFKERKSRNE